MNVTYSPDVITLIIIHRMISFKGRYFSQISFALHELGSLFQNKREYRSVYSAPAIVANNVSTKSPIYNYVDRILLCSLV